MPKTIFMEVMVLLVPKFQLEQVLHLLSNIKSRKILQLPCMETVQLIKDKFMKLQIWPLSGNFHVFSFAKTTYMVWELQMIELLLTQTIMLEVTQSQDLDVMLKMY